MQTIFNQFVEKFNGKSLNEILGCAKFSCEGLQLVKDVDEYDNNWTPAPSYTRTRRKQASTLKKPVFCVETKEVYLSATEAGERLGIDNRLISKCCNGVLIQTHGYHFCFAIGDYANFKPRENQQGQKGKKKILCVETGEIFITASNAAKIKKINTSSLSECLNKKKTTAGGFQWKYIDD